MQKTDQFIEDKRPNLPTFQADVGLGAMQPFQYDAYRKTLYTDLKDVNEKGGFATQVEVAITEQDKDEFAVQCWTMTSAFRAKYDADAAARQENGAPEDMPTEGPGIPLQDPLQDQEEEISESRPLIPEEERRDVKDVRQIPSQFTPFTPPPQPAAIDEEDLISAVVITNQRAAIEDLHELLQIYVEDAKAKQFGDRIYKRIGALYNDYGLGNTTQGTPADDS